jgi:hypothetical protein
MDAKKIMNSINVSREVIARQVEQRGTLPAARPADPVTGSEGLLESCLRQDLVRAADTLDSLGRIEADTRRELAAEAGRMRESGGDPPDPQ